MVEAGEEEAVKENLFLLRPHHQPHPQEEAEQQRLTGKQRATNRRQPRLKQ